MKVLLDTNVVLDVLLERQPWLSCAQTIWQAGLDGRLESCISASVCTDVFYIGRRSMGARKARQAVRDCLDVLTILTVDREILEHAHALAIVDDFEDAVQVACATHYQLDAIVTRDATGDFEQAAIPVWTPEELISRLENTGDGR